MKKNLDLGFNFYVEGSKISKITIFDSSTFSFNLLGENNLKDHIEQFFEKYFQGKLISLPLKRKFSPFQQSVYQALEMVLFGSTATHKELAINIGCPKGYRAVGNSLNKNPFPLAIPCHRVIPSKSSLKEIGGFAFGKRVKAKLLAFEKTLKKIS